MRANVKILILRIRRNMNPIKFEKLPEIVDGRLVGIFPEQLKNRNIKDVSIDSRNVKSGTVYIPIVGEKNDGHDFIQSAVNSGASAVVSERTAERLGLDVEELEKRGVLFVRVESVKDALKKLAGYNRSLSEIPVIAVTVSSGKTTTKDLIASVLSRKYTTLKTPENFNNEYGIPQTLLSLGPDDEAAVIEMGMDHVHDIDQSIELVRPQIAVITNIGTAHLEHLGSKENILLAKSEILNTLTRDQFALVNGDDRYLDRVAGGPFEVRRFGIDSDMLDLKARDCVSDTRGVRFTVGTDSYALSIPGIHNVYNALAAVWVGLRLGLTPEQIQEGFDDYSPSAHRMNLIEANGMTIIDDTYNANPDSMTAALNALEDTCGPERRKVAVLGDMLELGDSELVSHLDLGKEAAKTVDYLIGVGPASANTMRGAIRVRASIKGKYFADTETAAREIPALLQPGDIVLVKGSRGMKLEKVVEAVAGGVPA